MITRILKKILHNLPYIKNLVKERNRLTNENHLLRERVLKLMQEQEESLKKNNNKDDNNKDKVLESDYQIYFSGSISK